MKKGLRMFVRNEKLTDADWIELLEARRKLIKSITSRFTLEKLCKTRCLEIDGIYYEIGESAKTESDLPSLSTKTPGIFHVDPYKREPAVEDFFGKKIERGGIKRGWGLTKSGTWVVLEVSYYSYLGHKERLHEQVSSIRITKCSIAQVIERTGESPEGIWRKISEEIKKIEERAKRSYNEVASVRRVIEIEELAFGLVGENPKGVF